MNHEEQDPSREQPQVSRKQEADDVRDKQPQPTLKELIGRANSGDRAALRRLRKRLDKNPQLWEHASTLADRARDALIGLIVGDNKAGGEVIQCQLKKMQAELIGPDTTPVVRLAAERVLAIWLQVQLLDIRVTDQNASLDHLNFYSRQQDQASRRYAAALKMFATLQRFALATPSAKTQQRAKAAMPSVNAMRAMVAKMATPRTA